MKTGAMWITRVVSTVISLVVFGALGSGRNQTHATANRALGAGVYASLERHLDLDIETISLQSVGHLLEPPGFDADGAAAHAVDRSRPRCAAG